MKFFVITLHQSIGGLVYPAAYQPEIGDYAQDHLYYKDDGIKLMLAIKDADSSGIVRTDVVEVTQAAARIISETHEDRVEHITDEARVRRLTIKASLGQKFTTEEEDALDPSDSTPGINRRKIFIDRVDDLIAEGVT